jgi:transcription termination factor Rho
MHLKELKKTPPADLVTMAEELGVEGASTLRKQDLMFAILKAEVEVLPDGFGFLRSRKRTICRPGRHLCLAQPDPPLRPAHRRHGRRRDPRRPRTASAISR